jgi:hypothetical protein
LIKQHQFDQNDTEIQSLISSTMPSTQIRNTVVYQATPTLREIQEVQPLRRGTAARSFLKVTRA